MLEFMAYPRFGDGQNSGRGDNQLVVSCATPMTRIHGEGAMTFVDRASRRIKMNDLLMLLAVVERGSMSKAAQHLNISQSAISKALAGLEDRFGVRVLVRNPQGVEP